MLKFIKKNEDMQIYKNKNRFKKFTLKIYRS